MSKKPTEQPPASQQQPPMIQPMIDEMRESQKPKGEDASTTAPPPGPLTPPKPAELDQDAGGGYNPNHTIPQP